MPEMYALFMRSISYDEMHHDHPTEGRLYLFSSDVRYTLSQPHDNAPGANNQIGQHCLTTF